MKQISWLLGILLFLSPLQMSAQKQDTVAVRETRIPVLIERQDNELFNLRIDATQSQVLNDVKLSFGKEVNLNEIEAVKLYYGGTESSERKGKTYFAPVDYIPSNTPGKTLAANPSYSILKAEVKAPKRDVVLKVDQKLYPGVNYFWVSLQMKPTASVLAKVSVEMTGVTMDNRTAPVKVVRKADTHYMGVGVRHAGDDGVAAYRIPGLATSNKGTLLGVYDVRHNNSADLQEYVEIAKYYTEILQTANKFYDFVFVDLSKRMPPKEVTEILQTSDIIVMNLTQRLRTIDDFIALRENSEFYRRKNIILNIGRYDKFSKYNDKNITKYLREKQQVSVVPYNTLFFEACSEGTVIDLLLKLRSITDDTDRNVMFVKELKNLDNNIIVKMQELQMKK